MNRELLESLYESIRTEPFKIPQDDGNDLMHTFFNPDKEGSLGRENFCCKRKYLSWLFFSLGYLWKQGGRYKSWKRRWFILNDNCLYYFEFTTDKEPRGIIPLENIMVSSTHVTDHQKICILLTLFGCTTCENFSPDYLPKSYRQKSIQHEIFIFLFFFFFLQVRECKPADKSRQHCFELYATGGAEIIKACKTDSDGKVRREFLNSIIVLDVKN